MQALSASRLGLRAPFPSAICVPGTRHRPFSSASPARARATSEDHYEILDVPRGATKKEIKEKFYELSRKYHPDAPSTSTSESIESRTARFQTISQSYAVLSDDSLRRSYDQGSRGSSYVQPSYRPAQNQSGFGGGSAAAWSYGANDNASRRERANYAWSHPTRRKGEPSAAEAGANRPNPFATDEKMGATPMDDHFMRYAGREAMQRSRAGSRAAQKFGQKKGSPFSSGTEGFGAKAEVFLERFEESRLINDSAAARSGQVFFIFAGAFAVAVMFSRSGGKEKERR
ncbi:hypothetical protein P7C70_g4509, partial [Phenoliferia sp. Uapishka_3]